VGVDSQNSSISSHSLCNEMAAAASDCHLRVIQNVATVVIVAAATAKSGSITAMTNSHFLSFAPPV